MTKQLSNSFILKVFDSYYLVYSDVVDPIYSLLKCASTLPNNKAIKSPNNMAPSDETFDYELLPPESRTSTGIGK